MQKSLPKLNDATLQHSQRVAAFIAQHIQRSPKRCIPFSEFMRLALYAPGLGYYSSGQQKFGASGDFITAPLVSPLFAQCISHAIGPMLQQLGGADILELGPGDGTLMCQLLCALQQAGTLPRHYYCLELSAELQQRQRAMLQEKCPQHIDRVIWLQSLPATPMRGVILANEVLDAIPVERIRWHKQQLQQCMVALEDQHSDAPIFTWQYQASSLELNNAVKTIQSQLDAIPAEVDYYTEISLQIPAWLASLSQSLDRGSILFLDYGYPQHEYYHWQRTAGTLMCYLRHHAHDNPLLYPGVQDITAHINFTSLAYKAHDLGMSIDMYASQAEFLYAFGLADAITQAQHKVSATEQYQISKAIQTITAPQHMGEQVKVMALSKGLTQHHPYRIEASNHDRRHQLAGLE